MELFPNRFTSATAALLAAVFLSASGKTPADQQGRSALPPVPVQTGFAMRKDVPVDLTAIGNVESIATIAVKAQVTGELIDVSFTEGQDVKKGDLLFTIQPRLYATQLAQAEANLARDRAQASNAKRELARQEELARKNVLLNAVCPGPTNTPMMAAVLGEGEQAVKWKDAMVRGIPLKRMGEPDDYTGIIALLASEDGKFITGQAISVSGGMNMI